MTAKNDHRTCRGMNRKSVFATQRAANVAVLAAEAIANHAAAGRDVEGELADLGLHLQRIVDQLDELMG